MFASPGAIALQTPFMTIYWYGIILAIAFVIGQFVVIKVAENEYKNPKITEKFYDLAFWILVGGILGARLYYVLLGINYYAFHANEIFMLQQGGLSIHGGLIGGILGSVIYCKIKKLNFFLYADIYALGLPVAQAIGRWGNFFNSEAFGTPTTLPWGIFIPATSRPIDYKMYEFFHPTFLYESLWNILVFLILYFVLKRFFLQKRGVLFFSYLILYSFGRIIIETVRTDSVLLISGVSVAIWVCILTVLISSIFLIFILRKAD